MIFRILKILLLIFLPLDCPAADNSAVTEFRLQNGLRVLVIENHKIPAITHMMWYKVGASDEEWGKTGIAHFLEHMMFKETDMIKEGEFSRLISNFGGNNNAFTTDDKTVYFINIAREYLDLAMVLEANRMTSLKIDDDAVAREKQVILEERSKRIDNSPRSILYEQMCNVLYQNHPYSRPIIGWRHEIENLTGEDLREFHRKYYAPDNAILIVAGDVTADEIRPMVEKYYGAIPASGVSNVNDNRKAYFIREPEHIAAQRIIYKDKLAAEPEWKRVYIAPSIVSGKTEHAIPLAILAQILGGGESSILYRSLVMNKSMATQVYVGYDESTLGPSVFYIGVTPKEGIGLEKIEKEIDKEIAGVMKGGLPEEDIRLAKNVIIADSTYAQDGLQGLAMAYGMVVTIGIDKDFVVKWPENIRKIGKKEIHEAAKYLLKPENSVTGLLYPDKSKE